MKADGFRRLELTVRRRVNGTAYGELDGHRLGPGSEPEELAVYQPGHDVRRIDWNVTARTGQAHVWLTRAQHELETWLLLDRSPSMAFGTTTAEKLDLAESLAGAFGLITSAPGNRTGVGLIQDEGVRWFRPRPGQAAARTISQAPPASREPATAASLAEALRALEKRARRGGLCVILTDLVEPDGTFERPFDWEEPLRKLSARHDVIVAELVDPRELALPDLGNVIFLDPESGRQRDVPTSSRKLRRDYADAAARHREQTALAVRACRADHLRISTDSDWPAAVARLIFRRQRTPSRRTTRRTGSTR